MTTIKLAYATENQRRRLAEANDAIDNATVQLDALERELDALYAKRRSWEDYRDRQIAIAEEQVRLLDQ